MGIDGSLPFLEQSILYLTIFCLWVLSAVVSTSYTFSWDILMDWSLFPSIPKRCCRSDSLTLRGERIYTYKVGQHTLRWSSVFLSPTLSLLFLPPPSPYVPNFPSPPLLPLSHLTVVHTQFYYMLALVENFLFRTLWIFNLSVGNHVLRLLSNDIIATIAGVLEIVR